MTPEQFDQQIILKRQELIDAFKDGKVEDIEVLTKIVLDLQEAYSKNLLAEIDSLNSEVSSLSNEISSLSGQLAQTRGDILKDLRERIHLVLEELNKKPNA
jgi:uncharacterized coiled-coil DUF342 family protein